MRLELNLPALERLIAGDSELELHLRQQIVQEFARRHLKGVTEKATYQEALKVAKAFVNEAAKEQFYIENLATNHLWPTVGYRLKNLVAELTLKAIDGALSQIIEREKRYWEGEIKKAVRAEMSRQIEKEIEEGIQKRLQMAAKQC